MTHRYSRSGANRTATPVPQSGQLPVANRSNRQQTEPAPDRIRLGQVLGAALAIAIAAGGLVGSSWLAFRLIVNPQALIWVNRFLPGWIPLSVSGLEPPQTLAAIQQAITQSGQIPAEPLSLGRNVSIADRQISVSDILLPVLARTPNCQTNCDRIVELRVYQTAPHAQPANRQEFYQLVTRLTVKGPDESFVVAPIVDASTANQGSARRQPLTSLKLLENSPQGGVWLNLTGHWVRGEGAITYGQILHYNPAQFYLGVMVNWTSPAGEEPIWKEVTGGSPPELLVNQSQGMEPQYQIYQLLPIAFRLDPLELQPISLMEPAIHTPAYRQALLLARNGLWSTAEQWLQSLKRRTRQWPAQAQAQLDLVRWHAQLTHNQAKQSWASPSQAVLANLIDGRWQKALQVFAVKPENSLESISLLRADTGRLQNRLETFLRLNPADQAAKTWQALLLAAQRDRPTALAWLKKQPKTSAADINQIDGWLQRLQPPANESDPSVEVAAGQIMGVAQVLPQIQAADWLQPASGTALKLAPGQSWYRIQVAGWQNGKRWRLASTGLGLPANLSGAQLWQQLGLDQDTSIQITYWLADGEQFSLSATPQAVRWQGGQLELLVMGDRLPANLRLVNRPRPLALTESAWQWVSSDTQPLSQALQQQPETADRAIAALGQTLQQAGLVPNRQAVSPETLESLGIGNWPVQTVSLRSAQSADIVLTLTPAMMKDLAKVSHSATGRSPQSQSRTLILSPAGEILYNEFGANTANLFLAIADLGEAAPVLVVNTPTTYTFLRWSAKHHQFR